MRTLLVTAVVAMATLVAGCGSSEPDAPPVERDKGERSDLPDKTSLEVILEALECEEDDSDMAHPGEVMYHCPFSDRDDQDMIYIYAFGDVESAQSWAQSRVDFRSGDAEPRGLGWHEDWVIDTFSSAALEVAGDHGAEILIEGR